MFLLRRHHQQLPAGDGNVVNHLDRHLQKSGDGKDYIISYNDCCGKTSCGNCFCNRNEGDRPTYRPHTSNDYNWCLGTESTAYHCTVNLILGVAIK